MGIDLMETFYKFLVVFVYGSAAIIAILFIFSIKLYLRLDELLNMNFFVTKIISPAGIYRNVLGIDDWFIAHNKIAGIFLFVLSSCDLIMLYNIDIMHLF
ncbi:MAG: hypothetical protein ABIH18_08480 [Candidatus Omnitrophota bacterium]